ncbi:MAG: carbohydrate-binding protein, partial [Prolixibacteraceae bacterium]|nr:carbohydrate-binding protein [Prolixibacteraceae bacterium]
GSNMFYGTADVFPAPNHISPAVELDDGTSWVIAHSYRNGWYAHGRQGLLCEVVYNLNGFPKIKWPVTSAKYVPELSNKGIPWMVPHSDLFDSGKLNPEWSFLGYTPSNTWSLSENPGWLKLSPIPGKGENTVIKNDGEHNYSLITKVDFDPVSENHEAGLWIINGPETHQAKVISTVNPEGKKIIAFSFENTRYEVENTAGSVVWLKIIRNEHRMTGFFSSNGKFWTQIGEFIDASDIDIEQTQFNNFTGNQQGLYVKGKAAWFDLYIYRDAFTSISAASPANKYHTSVYENNPPPYTLTSIHNSDWTMYAGVEFGNSDYAIEADSVLVSASCATSGGKVRIVLDSLNGAMIAEVQITNTGGLNKFQDFTSKVTGQIFGCHDVYLKYSGFVTTELFRLKSFVFSEIDNATPVNDISGEKTGGIQLLTNYPNPYQTTTEIQYHIPCRSHISLKVYELNGRVIETLYEGIQQPGKYSSTFNSGGLSGGIYICRLVVEKSGKTQNLIIVKQN